jgi:hypothetical protein
VRLGRLVQGRSFGPGVASLARFRPLALADIYGSGQTMPARGLQRPSEHRYDINNRNETRNTAAVEKGRKVRIFSIDRYFNTC